MDLEKVIYPLMVAFEEDIQKNNGPSHITDLIILTIKSLLPSEVIVRVDIDYRRYKEELNLWKYYRNGDNPSLMNILESMKPNIYWKGKDNTLYYRLLPIILANKDFEAIKEEVIKNILFTTGNIETLIEGVLLSKIIHNLLLGKNDVIIGLKDEIINLSQREFLEKYKEYFRIPIEEYESNFSVEFEQYKIYALNVLNQSYSNRFKILEDCVEILLDNKEGNTTIGKYINSYENGEINKKFQLDNHYKELGVYVFNLRNGRIDPKLLKIHKYQLPDVFKFQQGEVFYHSLLNKAKVIKREDIGEKVTIHLKTKSGIYRLVNN